MSAVIVDPRMVEDFASFGRALDQASPENRRDIFRMLCREGVRWWTVGGASKVEVIDRLNEIGLGAGLDRDDIQAALADGVVNPLDLSKRSETPTNDEAVTDPRPPEFSDETLALRFTERHADDLRFVAAWGRWLAWEGKVWRFDDTLNAYDLSRAVCREASGECGQKKAASAIASAKTVAAVVTLARVDRRLAATADQWDSDPWLLNTPGGVIDLRSGNRRDHRPVDHLTRITEASPEGDCPTWRRFLGRVTDGDAALQAFLQRVAGYALTGLTSAHALFFLWGSGANGKSVFINTISGILGDYHKTAAIETFTASTVEQHPTALAGLRGARLVTAVETEEGRRWAEAKIKALTGGDKIAARFMRQDFFEFTPQFKLLIAGNHKPGLRSVDEAIRRRFHLVPFAVTIPPAERDETLSEQLRSEWGGILAWAIEGCLEWQRTGLAPPEAVTSATAAYLDGEDAVSAWLDEECERDVNGWSSLPHLFGAWKAWAERNGEDAGNNRRLGHTLETRGFRKERRTHARGFAGLRVTPKGMVWEER